MSNRTQPNFKIGEFVAVYAADGPGMKIVIPKTQVQDRIWVPKGSGVVVDGTPYTQAVSAWFYEVDGCEYFIIEHCLRPWRPDDYEDDSEEENINREWELLV